MYYEPLHHPKGAEVTSLIEIYMTHINWRRGKRKSVVNTKTSLRFWRNFFIITTEKTTRRDVLSRDASSYLKLLTASAISCTLPKERNLWTIIYKNLPNTGKKSITSIIHDSPPAFKQAFASKVLHTTALRAFKSSLDPAFLVDPFLFCLWGWPDVVGWAGIFALAFLRAPYWGLYAGLDRRPSISKCLVSTLLQLHLILRNRDFEGLLEQDTEEHIRN